MSCYLIGREESIDDVIRNNQNSLITLLFSTTNFAKVTKKELVNTTALIKKEFKKNALENNANIAKETRDIFVFVDLTNYLVTENKYTRTANINTMPLILFFYKGSQIASIQKADVESFKTTYDKIKEKLLTTNTNNTTNNTTTNNTTMTGNSEEGTAALSLQQVIQQKRREEIERLKQEYALKELIKLKKAKELQEKLT